LFLHLAEALAVVQEAVQELQEQQVRLTKDTPVAETLLLDLMAVAVAVALEQLAVIRQVQLVALVALEFLAQ
jgi:hypothetical protein